MRNEVRYISLTNIDATFKFNGGMSFVMLLNATFGEKKLQKTQMETVIK